MPCRECPQRCSSRASLVRASNRLWTFAFAMDSGCACSSSFLVQISSNDWFGIRVRDLLANVCVVKNNSNDNFCFLLTGKVSMKFEWVIFWRDQTYLHVMLSLLSPLLLQLFHSKYWISANNLRLFSRYITLWNFLHSFFSHSSSHLVLYFNFMGIISNPKNEYLNIHFKQSQIIFYDDDGLRSPNSPRL